MAVLTDEILMAHADGALDAETQGRIEALLKQDPDARRRIMAFRATDGSLSDLYKLEPAPPHLIEFVMTHGEGRAAAPRKRHSKQKRRMELLGRWRDALIPAGGVWQVAAASTAALIIGASAGYLVHGAGRVDIASSGSLVTLKQGQILAEGALRYVLETRPSGEEVRAMGGSKDSAVVQASLTFKTKQGRYCREYVIATAGAGQYAGLACRKEGGDWALEVHVPQAVKARPDETVLASGTDEEALNSIIDTKMDGIAFGKDAEDAAIAKGWK